MKPEEDKRIEKPCKHRWTEVMYGNGEFKGNPLVMIATFYCERCLAIRSKTIDMSWSKRWTEDAEQNV